MSAEIHRHSPLDPPGMTVRNATADETSVLLEELLRLTFAVRDLYASARYQSADAAIGLLRPLFDTHYAEQLRLVDVLVAGICALRGAHGVFAATFPLNTDPTYRFRALAPERLLCDLLYAHASVLSAVDTAGANGLQTDTSADADFAVGRVVLTNDLQSQSVREQLAVLQM